MAKAGDKRRLEQNTKKLTWLRYALLGALVLHLVWKSLVSTNAWSRAGIGGFVATALVELICYRALAQLAEPTFGGNGELIDGGADLTIGGVTAAYFDALYICIFVQIATVLSRWFWLVLLVIPAYGFWLLWTNFLGPWLLQPRQQEQQETEAMRLRREKAEKRQQRRANRYA